MIPFIRVYGAKTLKFDIQNQPSFSHFTIVRVYQCLVKQTMLKKKDKTQIIFLSAIQHICQSALYSFDMCLYKQTLFCILRIYMMNISF